MAPRTDNLTSAQRSYAMSRVKSKNTTPEKQIRSLIHRMGFRFRLNHPGLPGKPDIVLSRHKKIILVHGCFWHGHNCHHCQRKPKTNRRYWLAKIQKNKDRDRRAVRQLRHMGWRVLTIWQCQIKRLSRTSKQLKNFLAD